MLGPHLSFGKFDKYEECAGRHEEGHAGPPPRTQEDVPDGQPGGVTHTTSHPPGTREKCRG